MSDARLELWEELCHCGGARRSPDVRMCRCRAPDEAGLRCGACWSGVFLIKSGWRGNFWGCSMYKRRGCKNTMKFGPPYDAAARARLSGRYRDSAVADDSYARKSRAATTAHALQSARAHSDTPSDAEGRAWLVSEGMEEMLCNLRSPATKGYGRGCLAWHAAGMDGRVDMCRWLLSRGMGDLINERNSSGETALSYCVLSHSVEYRPMIAGHDDTRYAETAKWLLAHGADRDTVHEKYKDTLVSMLAIDGGLNKRDNTHVQTEAPKAKKRKLSADQRARMEKNRLACLARKRQKQAERAAAKRQVIDLTNKMPPTGVKQKGTKSCPVATGLSPDATANVAAFPANQKLVDTLTELAELAVQLKKTTRFRTYQKAAQSLAKCGFEVKSGLQVSEGEQKIRGIGKGTGDKISEILRTGTVVEITKWRALVAAKGSSCNL